MNADEQDRALKLTPNRKEAIANSPVVVMGPVVVGAIGRLCVAEARLVPWPPGDPNNKRAVSAARHILGVRRGAVAECRSMSGEHIYCRSAAAVDGLDDADAAVAAAEEALRRAHERRQLVLEAHVRRSKPLRVPS